MSGEERKDLVPSEEERKPTVYDDFVEGVATRDIARGHELDPMRTARIFKQVDKNGEIIHVAGRKGVAEDIGNTLEKGGYRVREWHIKRPSDVAKETEKVRPAMQKLIRETPKEVIGDPMGFVEEALKLPAREAPRLASGDMEEVANALKEFSQGGEKYGEEDH